MSPPAGTQLGFENGSSVGVPGHQHVAAGVPESSEETQNPRFDVNWNRRLADVPGDIPCGSARVIEYPEGDRLGTAAAESSVEIKHRAEHRVGLGDCDTGVRRDDARELTNVPSCRLESRRLCECARQAWRACEGGDR